MKCYVCNGTGKRFVPTSKNAITGNGYTADCLICNGTGKLVLNNEKWFCSLSTEEKARFLACEFTVACDDYAYSHNKETWNEKYWLEWLKREHK